MDSKVIDAQSASQLSFSNNQASGIPAFEIKTSEIKTSEIRTYEIKTSVDGLLPTGAHKIALKGTRAAPLLFR